MKASRVNDVAPQVVSTIIFWAVFLIFFAAVGQILGLAVVSDVLTRLARYLPSVPSGLGEVARFAVLAEGRVRVAASSSS